MSNMQERLATRMEIAMKAMMDRMTEMHREFEERMRRERSIMQKEIEVMIANNFGSSVHIPGELKQNATATHKMMAVPVDLVTTSVSSDIPPASTAITTTMETPTDVMSTLQLSTTTANTSLIKPSLQKPEPATINIRRPEFAQESSTEKESSDEDLLIMRQLGPRKWYSVENFRQKEPAQRPTGQKAKCKSPHIDASAQNTNRFNQDEARKLQALEEPLKREDALKILRRKRMINLPDAHQENVDWYDDVLARLTQSVERMRLISGYGCSPRWAWLKEKYKLQSMSDIPSFMHECAQALPMVC